MAALKDVEQNIRIATKITKTIFEMERAMSQLISRYRGASRNVIVAQGKLDVAIADGAQSEIDRAQEALAFFVKDAQVNLKMAVNWPWQIEDRVKESANRYGLAGVDAGLATLGYTRDQLRDEINEMKIIGTEAKRLNSTGSTYAEIADYIDSATTDNSRTEAMPFTASYVDDF